MSNIPENLKYTKDHEWIRHESDGTCLVGITDHAQDALGDVVFVELPDVGAVLGASDEIAVVESVKAASDIYAPVSGEVIAVNEALEDTPETVNEDPYNDGWFFKIHPEDVSELESLLDAEAYIASLEEE